MASYVLVHGSYQGGWIWKPTAQKLREAGETVYVPTLDGCGERSSTIRPGITITSQAREISDMMFYEDLDDVILVATSTGGLVVCVAASMSRERVSQVVFVDALAPQPGEKVTDIVKLDPNTPRVTTDLTQGPSHEELEERLFRELDPELKSWAIDRVTMHPIEAKDQPGALDEFWAQDWSATVVRCKMSANPPLDHQRRTAEKLNASWHELNAGHYPMLSHPDELSDILLGLK